MNAGVWRFAEESGRMNYLISLGKDIIKKRRLILDLSKADFKKRFVGS